MGGHSSGGLFPGTLGNLVLGGMADGRVSLDLGTGGARGLHNPVVDAVRVGSALKTDHDHAFPDIVDNYVGYARGFSLMGVDGRQRVLYQLAGSLNGSPGIFEWVVDPDLRTVSHRRFIRGGIISGRPNQRPGKD